jgi:hypothetical protein
MDVPQINLSLSHLYLEMARSIFTGIHLPEKKSTKQILDEKGIEPLAGIIFSITSATIIYSYLALEAFANYHLYQIWEYSRKAHDEFEELKQKDTKLEEKMMIAYANFYQDYGKVDKFEDLKETDLKMLDKRIKVICESLKIHKIHDVDAKLWQKFLELLKKARDFLVHPFPDPTKFQDMMKTLLIEKKIGEYIQIAQEIIKHFYKETGKKVPDWVEKNTLFLSKGYEYLDKKNC